jgi:uncharacterized membrane-anchored protein YhcB (DUF1043 family)
MLLISISILFGILLGLIILHYTERKRKTKLDKEIKKTREDILFKYNLNRNKEYDIDNIYWKHSDKENMIKIN